MEEKQLVLQAMGAWIRDERIRKKISRRRMARELGCSFTEVKEYEEGKREMRSGRLMEVLRVLGVSKIKAF
jgi:transcriptional regulator with XRE-family HTH domain